MSVAGILDAMRSDLPAAHRLVWQCLENHANSARVASVSAPQLAKELNLGSATVERAIRSLRIRGIISTTRRGFHANLIHMLRTYSKPHQIDDGTSPQNDGVNPLVSKNLLRHQIDGVMPPQNDGRYPGFPPGFQNAPPDPRRWLRRWANNPNPQLLHLLMIHERPLYDYLLANDPDATRFTNP